MTTYERQPAVQFDYAALEEARAEFHMPGGDPHKGAEMMRRLFERSLGSLPTLSGEAHSFLIRGTNIVRDYDRHVRYTDEEVMIHSVLEKGVAVDAADPRKRMDMHLPVLAWGSIDGFPESADGS